MSLLGDFGDVLGDNPSEGAIAYTRGAILWGFAAQEQSFASAMRAMRQAGVGIRNDQALSMWQDIQTTLSEAGAARAISFDQLASGALTGEPPPNWTGQIQYRVDFTMRTAGEPGEYLLESVPKWFVSDSVLTPEQAYNAAVNMISLPAGIGTPEGINLPDVIMGNLSGAWYRTRPGVLGNL